MKTLYQKLFFILLLIIGICLFKEDQIQKVMPQINTPQAISKEYIVEVKTKQKTLKVKLDDYLIGVVAGEMPANFEEEALKAQVVASRTFVLSRNLKVDNTTSSQVYLTESQMKSKWKRKYQTYYNKIKKAVSDTHNEVMCYQGEYISALFFSSSAGYTNNCGDYFEGSKPYLKSVKSSWDQKYDSHYTRSKTFSKKQLASLFNTSINKISITSYTTSGYVDKVLVNNKTYTGRQIREKLELASSCFKITFNSKGYTFTTQGSGHGVGMSQYGAQGMAKENKTYKDILNYYYQNIEFKRID